MSGLEAKIGLSDSQCTGLAREGTRAHASRTTCIGSRTASQIEPLKAGQCCSRGAVLCKLARHPVLFGRIAMKSFVLACVAAIVVAAVAAVVLNRVQEPVEQAFATAGVRL